MIGGEFDIDLGRVQSQNDSDVLTNDVTTFATGRSALYYILLDIKQRRRVSKVLIPDYLCSSVLVPISKCGLECVFYPLNDQLEMDREAFASHYENGAAVLIINYFGLMNLQPQIEYVRNLDAHAIIIEDDVQAYYEFSKSLGEVDYKFTSLRKSFAQPDGGLVKSRTKLKSAEPPNQFHQYKVAGSILKSLRNPLYYDDKVYLELFEKGESQIDDDIENGMSNISRQLLAQTDIHRMALIRQRNAQYIVNGLHQLDISPILPLNENKVPLFVPVWLNNRDKVRRYMFQHEVFCPIHWPQDDMPVKKGAEMAKHELSLIVDQRYGHEDMDVIIGLLSDCLK